MPGSDPEKRRRDRERHRRRDERRLAGGLCSRCARHRPVEGGRTCEACRRKRRMADRARAEQRRSAGCPPRHGSRGAQGRIPARPPTGRGPAGARAMRKMRSIPSRAGPSVVRRLRRTSPPRRAQALPQSPRGGSCIRPKIAAWQTPSGPGPFPQAPANPQRCRPLHPLRAPPARARRGQLRAMPGGATHRREGHLQLQAVLGPMRSMRHADVRRRTAVRPLRDPRRPPAAGPKRRRAPAVPRSARPPDLYALRKSPELRGLALPGLRPQGVRAIRTCPGVARVRVRIHRRARRHGKSTRCIRTLGGRGAVPVVREAVVR